MVTQRGMSRRSLRRRKAASVRCRTLSATQRVASAVSPSSCGTRSASAAPQRSQPASHHEPAETDRNRASGQRRNGRTPAPLSERPYPPPRNDFEVRLRGSDTSIQPLFAGSGPLPPQSRFQNPLEGGRKAPTVTFESTEGGPKARVTTFKSTKGGPKARAATFSRRGVRRPGYDFRIDSRGSEGARARLNRSRARARSENSPQAG